MRWQFYTITGILSIFIRLMTADRLKHEKCKQRIRTQNIEKDFAILYSTTVLHNLLIEMQFLDCALKLTEVKREIHVAYVILNHCAFFGHSRCRIL